jgi:DNA-binding transcriptional LysR family regulator
MLDATRLRVLVAVARYGSVTAAAQALNYAQPSISHHMARLEAETGAKLMERAGRGIRLTEAGQLLADRAQEILGRLDAAEAELAAHLGLRPDRVRLAAFGSALATIAATAAAALRAERADTDIRLVHAEPAEALKMLRAGEVEVALGYRYQLDGAPLEVQAADEADSRGEDDLHARAILDEPVYLVGAAGRTLADGLAGHARCRWLTGHEGCGDVLALLSHAAGFVPDVTARGQDFVTLQALTAAGLGVGILPGLALAAVAYPGIEAAELPGVRRTIEVVTYGEPPAPPATQYLVQALAVAAGAQAAQRLDRGGATSPVRIAETALEQLAARIAGQLGDEVD